MLKELGKSVLIYGVTSSLSKFVGILMIPFFSRYYSPNEYGTVDLISTVVSLVAVFGMLQLESAIARFYFEGRAGGFLKEYVSTGFWTIAISSGILFLGVILTSNTISRLLFGSEQYAEVFKLASANILLLNLFGYMTVIMRFENRPFLYSFAIFIQVLVTAIGSIVSVLAFDLGVLAFFIGQTCGSFVGCTILITYLRSSLRMTLSISILKVFFQYSLPQVPAVAGSWFNSYANRFVMIGYLTITDIGLYTVALKIASISNLIDSSFRMAWEPFLWKSIRSPDHHSIIKNTATIVTIIVFSLALSFILFTEELFIVFSTKEYAEAIPVAQILFYAFSFPVLVHVFGIGTSIAKRTIYNTISFFAGTIINIGFLFLLVPTFGLTAVPVSLAIGNIFIYCLMFYLSEKQYYIGFPVKQQFLAILTFSILSYLIFAYNPNLIEKLLMSAIILAIIIHKHKDIHTFTKRNFGPTIDT